MFPEFTSDSDGIEVEFQYESKNEKSKKNEKSLVRLHDTCGLVLVEEINAVAREHASRQEILRVSLKFVKEGQTVLNILPSKHVEVMCDGCNRSAIIRIR